MLIPVAVLCVLTSLFIVWEVAQRHLFPILTVGAQHALLTVWAGVVTAATCSGMYFIMHRHQRRLAQTAGRIGRLLESYKSSMPATAHFENRHLVHCREMTGCHRSECPMYDSPGERCWQVVGLNPQACNHGAPDVQIQHCHDCRVYRESCPDALTQLGESFNNLMYLLELEASQVGQMRAQMVEKEKMVAIGQMAAGIAHEIGNPLSSISSIVQLARRSGVGADLAEQLELIDKHIQRIVATVRQMSTLSRPGSEKWVWTDIGRMMADAIHLVSFDRRARKVEIDYQQPAEPMQTYSLHGQLQQVFINLALNALDAMADGGCFKIQTRTSPTEIIIRMEDNGVGIPGEIGRRIFEPFFTTKEPGQGTGLGLSVSYGIVQKHGGTIEMESTVGQGTAFTVHLPIINSAPDSKNV